jgi:hypothetical protein
VKERYNFYLNPSINNNPWNQEEDQQLIRLIEKHGKTWKTISEHFERRNEIQAKNRWNYTLSKHFSRTVEISDEENQTQNINKEFDFLIMKKILNFIYF